MEYLPPPGIQHSSPPARKAGGHLSSESFTSAAGFTRKLHKKITQKSGHRIYPE